MGFDALIALDQKSGVVALAHLYELIPSFVRFDRKTIQAVFVLFQNPARIFYMLGRHYVKRQVDVLARVAQIGIFAALAITLVLVECPLRYRVFELAELLEEWAGEIIIPAIVSTIPGIADMTVHTP